MLNTQSNTQEGALLSIHAGDLSGKDGLLLKLIASGVALPTGSADRPIYVLEDGGLGRSTVLPLCPSRNVRLRAKGTGAKGDALCLAAPAGADAGKVRAVPVAAGTYHVFAVAEEDFADGQLVLCRMISREAVVVA